MQAKRTLVWLLAAGAFLGTQGRGGAGPERVVSRVTGRARELVRLEVQPFVQNVEHGGLLQLRALGWTGDGTRQNVTLDVAWEVFPACRGTVDSLQRLVGGEPGPAKVRARLGSLRSAPLPIDVLEHGIPDWDVTHMERLRDGLRSDGSEMWCVHVKNYGTADAPPVPVEWRVDGQRALAGQLPKVARFNQTELVLRAPGDGKHHELELVVDPESAIPETTKANNRLRVATDALTVGFWVEESNLRYFHRHQRELGIGSNSWEDWAQRQITWWNEAARAGAPKATDRWRLDRIVVVGDGILPLSGGSARRTPDQRDQSVSLMRGFPAYNPARSDLYRRTTEKSLDNPFYVERELMDQIASNG